jgi:hypothetical protein
MTRRPRVLWVMREVNVKKRAERENKSTHLTIDWEPVTEKNNKIKYTIYIMRNEQ